jgi:hypothetical protein
MGKMFFSRPPLRLELLAHPSIGLGDHDADATLADFAVWKTGGEKVVNFPNGEVPAGGVAPLVGDGVRRIRASGGVWRCE